MPIFDFKCTECGVEAELLIVNEERAPACSKCGAKTEKLISGRGTFKLKGDRWCNTGYDVSKAKGTGQMQRQINKMITD